jgi:hypothetical protein
MGKTYDVIPYTGTSLTVGEKVTAAWTFGYGDLAPRQCNVNDQTINHGRTGGAFTLSYVYASDMSTINMTVIM